MLQLQPGVFLERLSPSHVNQIHRFDCGHSETNDFIRKSASTYDKENLGKTYVIQDAGGNVIAFFTLSMSVLKIKDAELALNLSNADKPKQLPALRIARLGTSKSAQGKGLGTLALKAVTNIFRLIQQDIGTRYVIVDAVPERVDWYAKRGFKSVFSDLEGRVTIPMYFRPPNTG